jgi:subtilisin
VFETKNSPEFKKGEIIMKRLFSTLSFIFISLFILGASGVSAQAGTPPGLESAPPCLDPDSPAALHGRVPCTGILLFREGTTKEDREDVIQGAGAMTQTHYDLVDASAVFVPDTGSLDALLNNPNVMEVIPDRPVHALENAKVSGNGHGKGSNGGGGTTTGQVVPSGVQRIGAAPGVLPVNGAGVGVAIVDTGLDFNHSDLDLNSGDPCFTAYTSCQDDNGHGTHVGGIVAALNNSIDVVGVAPAARLYAVKVLNSSGSGTDSSIMAGLNWVGLHANSVTPPIRVVNMSLGRPGSLNDNPALRASVQALHNNGISVVVAAGNDAKTEVSQQVPATYPEVMAVASATSRNGTSQCSYAGAIGADTASYFTTDGKYNTTTGIGVTISSPGEDQENISNTCYIQSNGILSLKLGGGTTRLSGTSMASPHVAGVVALMVQNAGGNLDPEVARSTIRSSAFRIGVAPLNSPTSSYTFDGEREGVVSACGVIGVACP